MCTAKDDTVYHDCNHDYDYPGVYLLILYFLLTLLTIKQILWFEMVVIHN